MIAKSQGARIVGIDINDASLDMAKALGAEVVINADQNADVAEALREATQGGAQVSIDALGIPATCTNSVWSLRKRGRHVQLGWMLGKDSTLPIPMDLVMGWELEIVGTYGMQAHRYGEMMDMIADGQLAPEKLIHEEITLVQSIDALANFDQHARAGMAIITDFTQTAA